MNAETCDDAVCVDDDAVETKMLLCVVCAALGMTECDVCAKNAPV